MGSTGGARLARQGWLGERAGSRLGAL